EGVWSGHRDPESAHGRPSLRAGWQRNLGLIECV
ncbi:MAG: hypothetical protein AVDCRST_MAG37-2811, partial [uncultured Rubrobacteraceae bacterium]